MRGAAERAVILAKKGLNEAAGCENFRWLCAGLSNKHVAASDAFRELAGRPLEEVAEPANSVEPAASNGAPSNDRIGRALQKVGTQCGVLREDRQRPCAPAPLRTWGNGASISKESFFVALVTDLPPRWIEDVYTKRR
jgi:hypothetical protein